MTYIYFNASYLYQLQQRKCLVSALKLPTMLFYCMYFEGYYNN